MRRWFLTLSSITGCSVIFCLYATGCFYIRMTEPMLRLGQDRYFPKKPKFTITPNCPPKTSPLSYDSIYVWQRVWEYESRSYTNYFHFRFWPSGECMCFVDTVDPKIAFVGDDFRDGEMGFFRIDGSNIAIGVYVPDSYNRHFGWVSSNEIHITRIDLQYAAAKRAHSSRQDMHFIRHQIGGMVRQPDWSPTGMLFKVDSPHPNP